MLLKRFYVNTDAGVVHHAITHEVHAAIRESNVAAGLVTIALPAPGAGVMIGETAPDALERCRMIFASWESAANPNANAGLDPDAAPPSPPRKPRIARPPTVDEAARAHVAAMFLGRTLTLPLEQGRLLLAPQSDILLWSFAAKAQRREFVVQILTEPAPPPPPAQGPPQEEYY